MKQRIYLLGLLTVLIVFAGIVLKLNHLAGASITITVGYIMLLLVFLPLALVNHYRSQGSSQNLLLYIVTYITCFLVFTSALFKIGHWPLAGTLLLIALPFPYLVFLPVFLWTTSKNKNFNINHTVFVLLLLVMISVFSGLLALNVSRNRIMDSFNIAMHYHKTSAVLQNSDGGNTSLVKAMDETLVTIREYRKAILAEEKMAESDWQNDPRSLRRPDIRGMAYYALFNAGGSEMITRLQNDLINLVSEMKLSPGYGTLAEKAPLIFDLVAPSGYEEEWPKWKFNGNNLSWVLIYLDGLETNIQLIRASLNP